MKIGIFYGSTTGNTEDVAGRICALVSGSRMIPVRDATRADFESCDLLLLGTSTWGLGELQEDWLDHLDSLRSADLKGKKVALFGLGDQLGYPDTFVDGLRPLHDAALEAGAAVIGEWPEDGYDCLASSALDEGRFLGLPLDQENQAELTDDRVQHWVAQVVGEAG